MSTVKEELFGFFDRLGQDHRLFRFLYNLNAQDFRPGVDAVYYSGPYWDKEELAAMMEAILTGRWLTSGEHVYHFERAFSSRFNQGHSVMVNSGSSANLVMVAALKRHFDWQDGDEVILSVVGFPTTVAPLVQNGLVPKFVDIRLSDLNFDLDGVEAAIGPRTRGIFVSPVLGNPPDMTRLKALCTERGLQLVLDDCDSLGSKWDGLLLSDYAVASSCSFYPAHHLCTGEGGMVSSNLEEVVTIARSLAWWGRDCYCVGPANLLPNGTCGKRFDRWLPDDDCVIDHKYLFTQMGYNLKPLDMQGAVGLVQLGKVDEIHRLRRENKAKIEAMFQRHVPEARVIVEDERAETSWFGVPIHCADKSLKQHLVAFLEANKIQTRNYFAGNILSHPAYAHLGRADDFPLAQRVLAEVFFVGCTPTYNAAMLAHIDETLSRFEGSLRVV